MLHVKGLFSIPLAGGATRKGRRAAGRAGGGGGGGGSLVRPCSSEWVLPGATRELKGLPTSALTTRKDPPAHRMWVRLGFRPSVRACCCVSVVRGQSWRKESAGAPKRRRELVSSLNPYSTSSPPSIPTQPRLLPQSLLNLVSSLNPYSTSSPHSIPTQPRLLTQSLLNLVSSLNPSSADSQLPHTSR
jgi:hypothetical protein